MDQCTAGLCTPVDSKTGLITISEILCQQERINRALFTLVDEEPVWN